jgi:TolB-like protein
MTIEHSEIVEATTRILGSTTFRKSIILSDFLNYIVHQTLAGNENILKEFVIATEVLNKKTDFDPQLDGIVRIHAGRLRKALNAYYQNEGVNDSIIISIPKGRYIPSFEDKAANTNHQKVAYKEAGQKEIVKPVVAVLPFNQFQGNVRLSVICSGLFQDLSVELSRFSEIGVISNFSAMAAMERISSSEDLASHLGVDFLIVGSCMEEGNRIQINVELNAVHKKQIVWAEQYYLDGIEDDKISKYDDIIRKIIAATCGFFGVIYRNALSKNPPQDYGLLYAIYWHNRYHREFSRDAFNETMKAVEIGLQQNPTNALLLAFKGELLLHLLVFDLQDGVDYLTIGTQLTRQAISLDPKNQHAYQTLAWANILQHDKPALLKSIQKCISLNPRNVLYQGEMGFGYICAGDYEVGMELMSDCVELNPYYQWNLNVGFCLYYIANEEYEEALIWADKVCRPALLWDPLLRIAALGLLNRKDAALGIIDELFVLSPKFTERARIIVDTFILDTRLQARILQGLKQGGIEIRE